MSNEVENQLYTVEEAAKQGHSHISCSHIRKCIYDGSLPAVRIGKKPLVRIRKSDLEKFLNGGSQ